jgi:hypothetical protein
MPPSAQGWNGEGGQGKGHIQLHLVIGSSLTHPIQSLSDNCAHFSTLGPKSEHCRELFSLLDFGIPNLSIVENCSHFSTLESRIRAFSRIVFTSRLWVPNPNILKSWPTAYSYIFNHIPVYSRTSTSIVPSHPTPHPPNEQMVLDMPSYREGAIIHNVAEEVSQSFFSELDVLEQNFKLRPKASLHK